MCTFRIHKEEAHCPCEVCPIPGDFPACIMVIVSYEWNWVIGSVLVPLQSPVFTDDLVSLWSWEVRGEFAEHYASSFFLTPSLSGKQIAWNTFALPEKITYPFKTNKCVRHSHLYILDEKTSTDRLSEYFKITEPINSGSRSNPGLLK